MRRRLDLATSTHHQKTRAALQIQTKPINEETGNAFAIVFLDFTEGRRGHTINGNTSTHRCTPRTGSTRF
jgi:mRNA-degrading endonuclease toxin of MazEF toxin-antitoxin module